VRHRQISWASVRIGFAAIILAAGSVVAGASDDLAPATISSMGQPSRIKPYVAGSFTWNREGEGRTGGLGLAGVYKDLVMPLTGAIGLSAEGYFGAAGGSWDGGARLLAPSGDTLAKIREAAEGFRRFPFLREEFRVPAELPRFLETVAAALEAAGYKSVALAEGREGPPRMHRKTQLFVTRRALRAVADDPRTLESLRRLLDTVAETTADPTSVLDEDDPLGTPNEILKGLRTSARETARNGIFYLVVGSKNQDSRSALLDGDVTCVVAGPAVLWSYADFMFLMAATNWLEDPATLDKLMPLPKEKHRWFHRKTRRMV
jgi:hypothetical protein